MTYFIRFSFISLSSLFFTLNDSYAEQVFLHEGKPAQLIELYTSEGCSSCPPADHYLASLLTSPRLWKERVPLAFHVDYWDYLGWKDPFAQSQFKERQYRYQRNGNTSGVYTPGWLVNGKEWRGFFQHKAIPQNTAINGGKLQATLKNNLLGIRYHALTKHNNLTAHAAVLGFDINSQIEAGENKGRELNHQFVVLHKFSKTSELHEWTFKLPLLQEDKRHALAVWITSSNLLPIQVTAGWINPQHYYVK